MGRYREKEREGDRERERKSKGERHQGHLELCAKMLSRTE